MPRPTHTPFALLVFTTELHTPASARQIISSRSLPSTNPPSGQMRCSRRQVATTFLASVTGPKTPATTHLLQLTEVQACCMQHHMQTSALHSAVSCIKLSHTSRTCHHQTSTMLLTTRSHLQMSHVLRLKKHSTQQAQHQHPENQKQCTRLSSGRRWQEPGL